MAQMAQGEQANQREFFARCASGFEKVLADELKGLRCRSVRPLKGGVAFFGQVEDGLRACLWSRVATRIQLVLARVGARDAQELYHALAAFPWEDHLAPGATLAVQAHGTNEQLRNTQFSALKVKDAVCDRLREVRGERPDVDAADPDFALDVAIHAEKATVYLNLSGASLHRRGYREAGKQVEAPLKETLAAGMLLAAGWPALAQAGGAFVDPMCGSGTLAVEAALIAAGAAPGLLREKWGFMGWSQHEPDVWERLVEQAKKVGVRAPTQAVRIFASDTDGRALRLAKANAERAGVAGLIAFKKADAAELQESFGQELGAESPHFAGGLLAVNPPYGKRLLAAGGLGLAYEALSQAVDALPEGWKLAVITPDQNIDTALGMMPDAVLSCFNGPLETGVRMYTVQATGRTRVPVVSLAGVERSVAVADRKSEQFAARLRKVAKERAKWARKEGVSCYRIYDADLPEYALAIDWFEGVEESEGQNFVRVSEYKAPASVDEVLAQRRFADAMALIPAVLDVDPSQVFSKVRQRDKGGQQYREARDESHVVHVQEAGYVFELDLGGYLDTGLFLDHRITREMVGEMARGTRFLNLFAYTGTATVYAAGADAAETTTVDLSNTYLDWAYRNLAGNNLVGDWDRFVRADTIPWLRAEERDGAQYDLIFCDPPTFSNSKAMGGHSFDVQRDHVKLLRAVAGVLAPDGTVVFSCNRRNFKLDTAALADFGLIAQDITAQTIPHDFSRTPKVHRCYLLHWA